MADDCKFTPISGPGVDALERRKEIGSRDPISEAEMRRSFETVRERLFAGIAQLVAR